MTRKSDKEKLEKESPTWSRIDDMAIIRKDGDVEINDYEDLEIKCNFLELENQNLKEIIRETQPVVESLIHLIEELSSVTSFKHRLLLGRIKAIL